MRTRRMRARAVLLHGQSVRFCLMPGIQAHGRSVITIEGPPARTANCTQFSGRSAPPTAYSGRRDAERVDSFCYHEPTPLRPVFGQA